MASLQKTAPQAPEVRDAADDLELLAFAVARIDLESRSDDMLWRQALVLSVRSPQLRQLDAAATKLERVTADLLDSLRRLVAPAPSAAAARRKPAAHAAPATPRREKRRQRTYRARRIVCWGLLG